MEGPLLEMLYQIYPDSSKKKLKSYLKSGCIYVDGRQVTKYDFWLKKGSQIDIRKENKTHKRSPLPIIYEDDNFIVVDKPNGLLSIGTLKEKEKTAYHKMRTFIKERGRGEKIFVLHRLDRDTSGILVFVKDEKLKHLLQENWNSCVKEREYVALVSGKAKDMDSIELYLTEGKDLKMHVTNNKGKKAITKYQCLKQNDAYSLLKVSIETGRKNQIRATLSFIGLPIVGDLKYGSLKKANRLYLHATKLILEHPITKKRYVFESKIPREFKEFFKTLRKDKNIL